MAVEPVEFVKIEDGRTRRDALERKGLRQLLQREGLRLAVLRSPAEQGQVVDQRLGQVAHLAEGRNRGGAMALGEPLAVGPQNRRKVSKLRHRPAEGLVNCHLLGGVRDVVVATDNVGDLHQRVVDGDHVVVYRDAPKAGASPGNGQAARSTHGRTDQNGVRDRLGGKLDLAAHQIVKAERVVLDAQPDGEGLACGQIFLDLRRR